MVNIFISIASYRDPDLVNTVRSAYENATQPDKLFFSILSQSDMHPDLSFVPTKQLRYLQVSHEASKGACWAREITSRQLKGTYFLQIDSHSRFRKGWDSLVIANYRRAQAYYGERIFLTHYPDPFELKEDGSTAYLGMPEHYKLNAYWHDSSKMVQGEWALTEDTEHGDEQYFMSANCLFTRTEFMQEVPYDSELYFTGEEPSLALRAYTRGFKLISPVVKFMFTNYNRENSKRPLHWNDHNDWWQLNQQSYKRLERIMKGYEMGVWGIGSQELYEDYMSRTGIDLRVQDYNI